MREFLKSTLRFSWAMFLFGAQQLKNVVEDPSQQESKAATALESVARATEEELSGIVKDAFKAGELLKCIKGDIRTNVRHRNFRSSC